ncbi:MAG: Asp23/Gls24 family envelope stress response protein [Oscillospiraceae bacterium]|nr:Asp23/Gls24 family envelope stress response protein [Oscillospiraceae bacterium]
MVKLENERGSINIASEVFTILTGDAATNCFGVKGMTVRSVSDGLVHLLKKESMGKGVHITYNDDNTISIELHIAVDQGVNIPVICESIVHRVRYQVEQGTGIKIKCVDVYVESMLIG